MKLTPGPRTARSLPAAEVVSIQRRRLLDAVIQQVGSRGYRATTVKTVAAASHVSPRTFYQQFRNLQEAYLVVYDEACDAVLECADADDGGLDFVSGVVYHLTHFLQWVAADPCRARAFIVEAGLAGPESLDKRDEVVHKVSETLHAAWRQAGGEIGPSIAAAEFAIEGVYGSVFRQVRTGAADRALELLPDLAHSLLVPYVGHDDAVCVADDRRAPGSSLRFS